MILSQPPIHIMSTQGIYIIFYNCNNSKFYIGQSIDIESRIKRHISQLEHNTHPNTKLQEDYYMYGTPEVYVLEETTDLNAREIYWIKEFDAYTIGYNLTIGGSTTVGEDNPFSLYTKEVYLSIAKQLANTNKSYKEIANELGVSDCVVRTIGTGQSHKWLLVEYPELYSKIENKWGKRSNLDRDKHERIFFRLVTTDDRLKDIAHDESVNITTVEKIAGGSSCLYLKDKYPEEYDIMMAKNGNRRVRAARQEAYPELRSPEGIIYNISNCREFCRKHNLHQSNLGRVLNGTSKIHKGWTLA